MKFSKICFVLGFLFLGAVCCSHREIALDMIEEARYAQRNHEFVFFDYLRKEAPIRREDGWTPLSKKGTRTGIFPCSRLNFTVDGKEPVYLSCRCKPTSKGIHPAHHLKIRVNGQRIPGEIDYFLHIPPGSSFRAQFRFLPLKSSRQNTLNLCLISLKPGGKERVVYEESIPLRRTESSLDVKLKGVEGIVKLPPELTTLAQLYPLQISRKGP